MVDVDSLRMDVTLDVRTAVRNVKVTKNAIEVARRSLELASRKLDAERKRYDLGRTTLRDKLEYEQEKIRAQTLYIRASIDYEQSVNGLERATANTLEKYDIDIERDHVATRALAASQNHINSNAEKD
jgi:outer membrane protein TolC